MARTAVWEQTVAELVRERGDALFRYALLLSGDPEDAQDLVQDALVRTFGRLRNGFTVESAEAYVRRAILNANLDRGRRASRWRRIAPLEYRPDEVEAPSGETDRRLDLHEELQKLSPRERACVVLRYYDDLKVDDIAGRLGISSGAVKRYLSDGLAKMALALAEDRAPEAQLDDEAVIAGARARRSPRAVLAGGLGALAALAVLTPAVLAGLPQTAVFDAAGAGGGAESAEAPAFGDTAPQAPEDGEERMELADRPFVIRGPEILAAAGTATTAELALANAGGVALVGRIVTAPELTVLRGESVVWRGPAGGDYEPVEVDLPAADHPAGDVPSVPFPVALPPLPAGDYLLHIAVPITLPDGSVVVMGSCDPHPLRVR